MIYVKYYKTEDETLQLYVDHYTFMFVSLFLQNIGIYFDSNNIYTESITGSFDSFCRVTIEYLGIISYNKILETHYKKAYKILMN